ncbi:MAG: flagellar biosynthesis protein FlgD [Rhodospirillaceae bacterium]|nr:MAG: flagellar biosynthesis protein FlgD [Rhodospirillaceae bacterium]
METNATGTNQLGLQNAGGASASLAGNFNDFLNLLTAQIQNQDPLSPMDSNEFTSQLVQFSAVEQAITTNSNLSSLIALEKANQITSAVGFLGTKIEAFGSTNSLTNGQAEFSYGLGANATSTQIIILDDVGQTIFNTAGETASGHHTFVWNGLDNNGTAQPDGKYSILVTSLDASGDPINTETGIVGTVTGFETTGDGSILLSLNGIGIPISDIVSVSHDQSGSGI